MQSSPAGNVPHLSVGTVRHVRLRPVRHAFAYEVYQLRLPLRSLADRPLANAVLSHNRFNLFTFHDADHGDGASPPLVWIENLLRREGIGDATGEIWLQTFPRVLGYVFNPVSFWFCERADGALRAIVCEVNNTFGERHCYLLADPEGSSLRWGTELSTRKVFHVSPFCGVEGNYRFHFDQELQASGELHHSARIDYDDSDGPLLLTSIDGDSRPLTTVGLLSIFLRLPFMTIAVSLRIHWQALRLWRQRMRFFPKPLPPSEEVSR
jgi:uncharacterized protein